MKRKTSLERSFNTVSFRDSRLRMKTTSKKIKLSLVDPVFKKPSPARYDLFCSLSNMTSVMTIAWLKRQNGLNLIKFILAIILIFYESLLFLSIIFDSLESATFPSKSPTRKSLKLNDSSGVCYSRLANRRWNCTRLYSFTFYSSC